MKKKIIPFLLSLSILITSFTIYPFSCTKVTLDKSSIAISIRLPIQPQIHIPEPSVEDPSGEGA